MPSRIRSASPTRSRMLRAVDVGDDRLDVHAGIDRGQLAGGGFRLGQVLCHVVFVEEHLPLQVVRFDEVAIDQAQMADAGPHQRVGQHGAERSAAAQGDVAISELLLPGFAHAVEAHLPAVAIERHVLTHPCPRPPDHSRSVGSSARE